MMPVMAPCRSGLLQTMPSLCVEAVQDALGLEQGQPAEQAGAKGTVEKQQALRTQLRRPARGPPGPRLAAPGAAGNRPTARGARPPAARNGAAGRGVGRPWAGIGRGPPPARRRRARPARGAAALREAGWARRGSERIDAYSSDGSKGTFPNVIGIYAYLYAFVTKKGGLAAPEVKDLALRNSRGCRSCRSHRGHTSRKSVRPASTRSARRRRSPP